MLVNAGFPLRSEYLPLDPPAHTRALGVAPLSLVHAHGVGFAAREVLRKGFVGARLAREGLGRSS